MNNIETVLGILCNVLVVGVLGYILILDFIKDKNLKKVCTTTIDATVVDYRYIRRAKHCHHRAIYEYEYNGRMYKTQSIHNWNNFRFPNYNVKIKINPDDPRTIYDTNVSCNVLLCILNIAVIIAVVVLFLYYIV